jgi:hypothetical protein
MHFRGPFPTEGLEPETVRSAIMLYHSGQTEVGLRKYEKARRLFALSCLRLKLDTTARAPALNIRTIHNMGYCHYRLGHSESAKRCASQLRWISRALRE